MRRTQNARWSKDERKFAVQYWGRQGVTEYSRNMGLDTAPLGGMNNAMTAAEVRRMVTGMDHGEFSELRITTGR